MRQRRISYTTAIGAAIVFTGSPNACGEFVVDDEGASSGDLIRG